MGLFEVLLLAVGLAMDAFAVSICKGLAAGKVTKKNIKVTVAKDTFMFKSVTYAGKSLLYDFSKGANNNNYIYSGANKQRMSYTTKKAGKFKVTPSKDYKIVNIWVERDNAWVPYADPDRNYDDKYGTCNVSELIRQKTPVDLNGDGDCFDTIDGINEAAGATYSLQRLKNGKKLVLGKNVYKKDYKYSYQSKLSKSNSSSYTKDESNLITTDIVVVYQNKITKQYGSYPFSITLRVGK